MSVSGRQSVCGWLVGVKLARAIHLINSNNITVTRNVVSNSSSIGIQLSSSINNNVTENQVTACGDSGTYTDYGSGNRIIGNNVTGNQYGISVIASSNDYVYHNYFINNTHQVVTTFSGVNYWDNGYPLPEGGGNYWSDFKTRYPSVNDAKSGPYQNVTGSDGIDRSRMRAQLRRKTFCLGTRIYEVSYALWNLKRKHKWLRFACPR